jgi:acyl-CoA synthetase (AMP-forming)/AMP-acid ligase II
MTSFQPHSLPDLLDHAASYFPDHGFHFIIPHHPTKYFSFPEMRSSALAILNALQTRGLKQGDRVILSLDTAEEIIPALWACLYGGLIPALLQPPLSFTETNPAAEKAYRVWQILDGPAVILSHAHAGSWTRSKVPGDRLLDIATLAGNPNEALIYFTKADDVALIQFSSGSTGDPKGVMLSHRNLLANTAAIIRGISLHSGDVSVNWMPLYHDMGLIGFHITPVYAGVTQYFINPADFVKNPYLWIDALSNHHCTITACPNFGQALVNRHLSRKPAHHWALSAIRILFNGAEPISVPIMKSFLKGLEPYGLNPEAMFPAYGLAEATLAVTFPEQGTGAAIIPFNRRKLLGEGQAEIGGPDDSMELVDLGSPVDQCRIRIVSNDGAEVKEGVVGHVNVRGTNITRGYYANQEATTAAFDGEWLRTGDLGFIFDGKLFITGRTKDIIFINGMNYYAHDVEHVALQMEGTGNGKVVVTGYFDETEGRDRLLVFLVGAEQEESLTVCRQMKQHLSSRIGLNPDLFILIRSSDIPRTSSGKIQRYKLAERFLRGEFSRIWKPE